MNDLDKLFPKIVIDQSAHSVEDVMEYSSQSREQASRRMREAVASGEWEEVRKRAKSGRIVKAYRMKPAQ